MILGNSLLMTSSTFLILQGLIYLPPALHIDYIDYRASSLGPRLGNKHMEVPEIYDMKLGNDLSPVTSQNIEDPCSNVVWQILRYL